LISVFLYGICTAGTGDLSRKADSLFSAGAFEHASLEYERIVFFSNSDSARHFALVGKAFCYKSLKKYDEAYRTFTRINTENKPDTFAFMVHYESALCAFLSNSYLQAENELAVLSLRVKDSSLKITALFLEILLLTEMERWKPAEEKYIMYCKLRGISPDTLVISGSEELKLKNRKTAMFLSLLFPGAGQAYAGKPLRGLSSLILTGAAVTYAVFSGMQGLWLTTVFTGAGFTLRFYAGGTRYSMRIADQKNEKIKADYKKSVRSLMLSSEDAFLKK